LGLRGSVNRDSRDSFLRPTEGSFFEAGYEQVLGDFNFPLLTGEASKFFTLYQRPDGSGKQVLALRSQLMFSHGDIPIFERFYAGGFRSLRGFEFRGVGPFQQGLNVGGTFAWLNSAEYQIPLVASDGFYMVGFVDSGTVESNVEINNYRVTAGLGMRIVVPALGPLPIALDFGVPVVKAPQDREQIFSFWLGYFY
jgi:outer membrane protein assembly factor BamA